MVIAHTYKFRKRNVMTKIILAIIAMFFITASAVAQQVLTSAEVKLRPPLKSDWAFKSDAIILNQQMTKETCFLNTLNGVIAVSLSDGKVVWNYSFPTERGINSVVTFSESYGVYVSYTYNDSTEKGTSSLTLRDLSTGKEKWSLSSSEVRYRPSAIVNDNAVFCIVGPPKKWKELKDYFEMRMDEAKLTAFSLAEGKMLWETELDDENSNLIAVEGGHVFLTCDQDVSDSGSPKNRVKCYDASKGKELWEYNPSGMLLKVEIADVKVHGGALFTFPKVHAELGQIARLNPSDGEEIWSKNIAAGFNNCSFFDTTVFAASQYWQAFRLSDGEKLVQKKIVGTSLLSVLGQAVGKLAFSIPGFNLLLLPVGIVALFTPSDPNLGPAFIPTRFIFSGLQREALANDKGLYSLVKEKDEATLVIMNKDDADDKRIEYLLKEEAPDLHLANGCSATHAFLTTKGRVIAVDLAAGTLDWEKDFNIVNSDPSLGLVTTGDKMYLFTLHQLIQLSNE